MFLRIATPILAFALLLGSLLLGLGCERQESAPSTAVPTPAASASAQPDPKLVGEYPLEVCVVSGEKLGDHGEPFDHMHEGRLVRFCCEACLPDFSADPAKHLAKIDDAAKAKQPAN